MKRIFWTAAIALTLGLAGLAQADGHQVSIQDGKIHWLGKKITGQHDGHLTIKEGSLTKNDKGEFTAAEFTADMTSITVADIKDADKNKNLVDHLKSKDFFSVDSHKTAQFKSTKVEKIKEGQYKVTGDLTIKGITKPQTFTANVIQKDKGYQMTAKLVVDRTKYDVRYGSNKFFDNLGDRVIYDDFELNVKANAQ